MAETTTPRRSVDQLGRLFAIIGESCCRLPEERAAGAVEVLDAFARLVADEAGLAEAFR